MLAAHAMVYMEPSWVKPPQCHGKVYASPWGRGHPLDAGEDCSTRIPGSDFNLCQCAFKVQQRGTDPAKNETYSK